MYAQWTAQYSLDYGVNNSAYGTVTATPPPDANGFYADGTTVTLTKAAIGDLDVPFSYWAVDGVSAGSASKLTLTMNANKTVRAVFERKITVTNEATLRSALNNALDADVMAGGVAGGYRGPVAFYLG